MWPFPRACAITSSLHACTSAHPSSHTCSPCILHPAQRTMRSVESSPALPQPSPPRLPKQGHIGPFLHTSLKQQPPRDHTPYFRCATGFLSYGELGNTTSWAADVLADKAKPELPLSSPSDSRGAPLISPTWGGRKGNPLVDAGGHFLSDNRRHPPQTECSWLHPLSCMVCCSVRTQSSEL